LLRGSGLGTVLAQTSTIQEVACVQAQAIDRPADVRFGSKADMRVAKRDVGFGPKATAKADSRKRSCLIYPEKRACAAHRLMSGLSQKRTPPKADTLAALSCNSSVRRRFLNVLGN